MTPRMNWFRMLLHFAGVILLAMPAAAQEKVANVSGPDAGPELLTRCATVSLVTTSGWLSPGLLAERLQNRDEFRNAGLKLVAAEEAADVRVTVSDEFDEQHGFNSIAALGERDAFIHAVRTRDQRTASNTVSAFGFYEGMVASAIVDTLHQLCPAVMTAARMRGSALATLDPAVVDALQRGHTLAVDSFTYLDDAAFVRKLAARPEIKAWNIVVSADHGNADLRLHIGRLSNSRTWHCELYDRTQRLLWMHSAGALTEEHAVNGIIDGLIEQIGRYRESPGSVRTPRQYENNRVRRGSWHARLITGDFNTTLQPMDITVDGEHFIARDVLGRDVYAIAAEDLEDVDHSTVRDAVYQLPPPTMLVNLLSEEFNNPGDADPRGVVVTISGLMASIGAYCASAGGLSAFLLPFGARQHFIEIAWKDGEVHYTAMFQLSGRDAGRLLDATRTLIASEKTPH